ncbi:MAG TPA: UDP-N-acetylmuramate dehydrogenase, partial [Rhodanobacter sp.]|nr:UDP-N-acetylmuramate dehydrogenase [Rhodanobacter sp.]
MGGYTLIENAPLANRNTLRVDARARLLAEINDASKLPELLDFPAVRNSRLLVLGEGSNVLFTGDFAGTVLVMATRGVQVESDGDSARIAVAAGERWDDFVRWTLGQGYAGLENLILIPGTVGAAPIQNIGAYGCEVAEFVESVEAWDTRERRVATLDHATCAFGYRDSLFKHEPGRYIVTAVRFLLPRNRPLRTDYAGIDEQLARMGVEKPAPFHVAEAVVHLRTKKLPDPSVIGNAGSFFKNPIVDATTADTLKRHHPDLPAWPMPDGRCKLSAAWMIEQGGFKGLREG